MFAWREYLELGIRLQSQADSEAALRSAVSRFYYGAYQNARVEAEAHGFVRTGTGGDHSALRRHLMARGKRTLARHLSDLQIWRERCDYEDEVANLPLLVAQARESAEAAFRLV